jgi:hypothetical protein
MKILFLPETLIPVICIISSYMQIEPFSASICSMFTCRSGKAEKSAVKDFLNDSGVFPELLVRFVAIYLSRAVRLCLLKTSTINDLVSYFLPIIWIVVVVVLLSFVGS